MSDQYKILIEAISFLHKLLSRIYKNSLIDLPLRSRDMKQIRKYYDSALAHDARKRDLKISMEEEDLFIELFDKNYSEEKNMNQIMLDTIENYNLQMKDHEILGKKEEKESKFPIRKKRKYEKDG